MSPAPLVLSLLLAALFLALAALSLVTARGGWRGTLRRQGKLGIHSPAAMDDDTHFQVANRVAAPVVAAAGAVAIVLAVVLLALSWSTPTSVVIGVVGLAGVFGLQLAAGVLGERAARALPRAARKPAGGAGCGGCACGGGGCAGLTRTDPATTGTA